MLYGHSSAHFTHFLIQIPAIFSCSKYIYSAHNSQLWQCMVSERLRFCSFVSALCPGHNFMIPQHPLCWIWIKDRRSNYLCWSCSTCALGSSYVAIVISGNLSEIWKMRPQRIIDLFLLFLFKLEEILAAFEVAFSKPLLTHSVHPPSDSIQSVLVLFSVFLNYSWFLLQFCPF